MGFRNHHAGLVLEYPCMERQDLSQSQLGSFKFTPIDNVPPSQSFPDWQGAHQFAASIEARSTISGYEYTQFLASPEYHPATILPTTSAKESQITPALDPNFFNNHIKPDIGESRLRLGRAAFRSALQSATASPPKHSSSSLVNAHYEHEADAVVMPDTIVQNHQHQHKLSDLDPTAGTFTPKMAPSPSVLSEDESVSFNKSLCRALFNEQQAHQATQKAHQITRVALEKETTRGAELAKELQKANEQNKSLLSTIHMLGGILRHNIPSHLEKPIQVGSETSFAAKNDSHLAQLQHVSSPGQALSSANEPTTQLAKAHDNEYQIVHADCVTSEDKEAMLNQCKSTDPAKPVEEETANAPKKGPRAVRDLIVDSPESDRSESLNITSSGKQPASIKSTVESSSLNDLSYDAPLRSHVSFSESVYDHENQDPSLLSNIDAKPKTSTVKEPQSHEHQTSNQSWNRETLANAQNTGDKKATHPKIASLLKEVSLFRADRIFEKPTVERVSRVTLNLKNEEPVEISVNTPNTSARQDAMYKADQNPQLHNISQANRPTWSWQDKDLSDTNLCPILQEKINTDGTKAVRGDEKIQDRVFYANEGKEKLHEKHRQFDYNDQADIGPEDCGTTRQEVVEKFPQKGAIKSVGEEDSATLTYDDPVVSPIAITDQVPRIPPGFANRPGKAGIISDTKFYAPFLLDLPWVLTDKNPLFANDKEKEIALGFQSATLLKDSNFFHHPVRFFGAKNDNNTYRTVMLDFIPLGTRYPDVLRQVRGGALESIQLFNPIGQTTNFMTARVVFLDELSAIFMEIHAREHGIAINGTYVRVWLVNEETYPVNKSLKNAIDQKYTRVLLIDGASPDKFSFLEVKLQHLIRERAIVGYGRSHDDTPMIEFNSIHAASRALEQLMVDPDFVGCSFDFEEDPCKEDYDLYRRKTEKLEEKDSDGDSPMGD